MRVTLCDAYEVAAELGCEPTTGLGWKEQAFSEEAEA